MRTSDLGTAFLAAHEGIVPAVYIDRVAKPPVPTFGIGHTHRAGGLDPRTMPRGMPQTPAALDAALRLAVEVFLRDLEKFEGRVAAALGKPVPQSQFDALVSFDFNTGAAHRARVVRLTADGAPAAEVRRAFMNWTRAGNDRNALTTRRNAEFNLWNGRRPHATIPVWGVDKDGDVIFSSPIKVLRVEDFLAIVNEVRARGASRAPQDGVAATGLVGADPVAPLLPRIKALFKRLAGG